VWIILQRVNQIPALGKLAKKRPSKIEGFAVFKRHSVRSKIPNILPLLPFYQSGGVSFESKSPFIIILWQAALPSASGGT
jgi:hypothetical protein